MIFSKKLYPTIAFLLILCFLLCTLSSCQTSNLDIPFELLNESEEEQEETTTAPDPLTLYRIVIPSSCSATLFSAAKDLAEKLTEQTGIASEVLYDTEKALPSERAVEILLGSCERTEAKRALSTLRRDDYLCQVVGNTTILGGNSEATTLAALDRFYEEFLAYATAYDFLPASASFVHRAQYSISSITVNGFDLCEYAILYDTKASGKEYALAKQLQERIYTEGGYALDLISVDDFQGNCKQLHLTIDPEETEETYRILANDRGITLSARNLFGLSLAVAQWTNRLLSATENKTVSLSIPAQESFLYSHIAPTIASLWLHPENQNLADLRTLENAIKQQHPDFVFIDQLSDAQASCLSNWLSVNSSEKVLQLFQANSSCRLLSNVSEEFECSAKIYQIGEGDDAFLLLALDRFPTKKLSDVFKNWNLPLAIMVHTDANGVSDPKTSFSEDGLMLEHFEIYQHDGAYRTFAVYTETNCFEEIQALGDGGYRSVTLRRISALYPHPS